MGVILGSAVVPIALCITWSKANKWGCIGGSISGFFAGLIAWLVTTSTLNGGAINVTVRNLIISLIEARLKNGTHRPAVETTRCLPETLLASVLVL